MATVKPLFITDSFKDAADKSGLVVHAALTSSTAIDGGTLTDGATATYDAAGMYNGGDGWIQWTPSASDADLLQENSHIHFEVESSLRDITGTGNRRIVTLAAGGTRFNVDSGENIINGLDGSLTAISARINSDGAARPKSHMYFDIIQNSGEILTYLDGLFLYREARTITANSFDTVNIFASQIGTELWTLAEKARNFYVRTGAFGMIRHPQLSNIHQYGDSLTQQGNLQAGLPDANGIAGTDHADLCATAAIHKRLAGKYIKAQVINHGVSGDALADLQAIIDATPSYELTGKVVIVNIGTNDAKTGTLTTNFAADYLTLINDILAMNPDHLFVCTLTPTADDTTYPWATAKPAYLEANAAISAAADSSSGVTEIDLYAFAGGDNYDSSDYKANDLHWSSIGSNKFGDYQAKIVMEHYYL